MLTIGFPAAAFGTNCYVLAPAAGEECLVVDPGIGVEETLRDVLAEHRLRPAAVLLTHGHIDHVYSVTPVCGGRHAAYIHADDRYRLHDPLVASRTRGCSRCSSSSSARRRRGREPETVVEITDGTASGAGRPGRRGAARPGPHRGVGDVRPRPRARRHPDESAGVRPHDGERRRALRRLHRAHRPARRRPGRDAALAARRRAARCPTRRWCCPGTGQATTMQHERATNPYLQGLTA